MCRTVLGDFVISLPVFSLASPTCLGYNGARDRVMDRPHAMFPDDVLPFVAEFSHVVKTSRDLLFVPYTPHVVKTGRNRDAETSHKPKGIAVREARSPTRQRPSGSLKRANLDR